MTDQVDPLNAAGPYAGLSNPFRKSSQEDSKNDDRYGQTLERGAALQRRPYEAAGARNIQRQHLKDRMTVWERIRFLADSQPQVLYQNWGPNLDGASLVTAIIQIDGRDVAVYGHEL